MAKCGPKGPSKYTHDFVESLVEKLTIYTRNTQVPWIKEFAYENHIPSCDFAKVCEKSKRLSNALKELKDKQEYSLVRLTLEGKLTPAMAIFALKNVSGWRDKHEIKHDGMNQFIQLSVASGVKISKENRLHGIIDEKS